MNLKLLAALLAACTQENMVKQSADMYCEMDEECQPDYASYVANKGMQGCKDDYTTTAQGDLNVRGKAEVDWDKFNEVKWLNDEFRCDPISNYSNPQRLGLNDDTAPYIYLLDPYTLYQYTKDADVKGATKRR